MADSYRIMQVAETGEAFCIGDGLSMGEAEDWVCDNGNFYPECGFKIEKVVDDPYYYDEPAELDFGD